MNKLNRIFAVIKGQPLTTLTVVAMIPFIGYNLYQIMNTCPATALVHGVGAFLTSAAEFIAFGALKSAYDNLCNTNENIK